MAIVAADWTIDRDTGNIRYVGDDHDGVSPSYATVIQFHRWVQGLADDAVAVPSSGDELDITNLLPSNRSTDNIITLLSTYNIDDTAAEHLYDGSIIQSSGDEIYDGIVNYGNADVQIQIIQDGAVLADDWWNYNSAGLNADSDAGISHRFMIKVRTGGSDINGRKLLGTTRTFGNTYAEFPINGTSRGNNVLALSDSNDLNNETLEATVSGWTTITNLTEGYAGIDVNNDGTDEYYYSEWDKDSYTINQFYERMKWLTRDGSSSTLYGLNGELFRGITHEINIDNVSTTDFSAYEEVTWTGGSGQMLAIDDVNAGTKMWIQLLTGSAPTDGQTITGGTSGATADVNTTVTDRSSLIQAPFCGVSTGSAIIGSYGFGIQATDLTSADKVFDLTNTQVTPPNYVTNTVGGLVSGEDRVLVAPWDGTTNDDEGNPAIEKDQLSLDTALTTDNITAVEITETIPDDTPSTGWIRVTDDDGFERRLHYSGWENGTPNQFTIDTTDGNEDFASVNASIGNDIYIAYIDVLADAATEAFTSVYDTDRDLVVIVRDGGASPIKQFISAWSLGSSNSTITAIRTTDA